MAWLFVRLKARLIRNGLRGKRFQVVAFIGGILFGAQFALIGFVLLAAPPGGPGYTAIPVVAFSVAFVGWLVVPVLGTGLDETLDPWRLMLLPLDRRRLMLGLLAASAVGIAPAATLVALSGTLVGYGGSLPGFGLVLTAVVVGFALCLAGARALTTFLSRLLRSRKARDVTMIILPLLGLLPALAGQTPRLLGNGGRISPGIADRLTGFLGWTPPGLLGRSVSNAGAGRFTVAALELLPAVILLGLLTWWWATNLDRLSTTAEPSAGTRRSTRELGAVGSMSPRWEKWLPDGRVGAVAAKELRYMWRDPVQRGARLTTALVAIGAVVAAIVIPSVRRPEFVLVSVALIWYFSMGVLNQFGTDRGAYWMNVVASGDPSDDLLGKNLASALITLPVFVFMALALAVITGGWGYIPTATTSAAGLLGVQFGLGNVTSVRLPQPLPESPTNLWAARQGQGCGTALLMLLVFLGNFVLIAPISGLVLAGLQVWRPLLALAIPFSLAYGFVLYRIGHNIAAEWLRGHQSELLESIGPRQTA